MKFTFSWLKKFLETDKTATEIANKLTEIGFELEEMIDSAKSLAGFKIAKILEAEPHPEADKLRKCLVDAGSEKLQIVCGAPNARAGIFVVLAPIGVTVPANGLVIKKSQIRGVESCGMLCSASELGLSNESEGILELDAKDSQIGKNFASEFGHDDVIFDVAVPPNRADCLGVLGLAREAAAAGMGKLKNFSSPEPKASFETSITLNVDDASSCPLLTIREIRGVKNVESPAFLQKFLQDVGIKPISALVDITNFVCHSLGQPLHAHDADLVEGQISVRNAKIGENFATFAGENLSLFAEDLVISDKNKILALAGIIGAQNSAISLNSSRVFLEAANFDPATVAISGRKHKIITESRFRFERHVDQNLALKASNMACQMILEICGGEVSSLKHVGNLVKEKKTFNFNINSVSKITGIEINEEKIAEILINLEFVILSKKENMWNLEIPSHRSDVNIKEEIVEEIIRIHGFSNLRGEKMPAFDISHFRLFSQAQTRILMARRHLAARGLNEIVSWSFMDSQKAIHFGPINPDLLIKNPISAELNLMRPVILSNLLDVAQNNFNRGIKDLAIFEIGPIYFSDKPEGQKEQICGLRMGKNERKSIHAAGRENDIFDVKSDIYSLISQMGFDINKLKISPEEAPSHYHPGRKAALKIGPKIVGHFGELHPGILQKLNLKIGKICAFELFTDEIPLSKNRKGKKPVFEASNFQHVKRDFAFLAESHVKAEEIVSAAKSANTHLIEDVHVFDIFKQENSDQFSIAIEVIICSSEKTLTDKEIEQVYESIVGNVERKTSSKFKRI